MREEQDSYSVRSERQFWERLDYDLLFRRGDARGGEVLDVCRRRLDTDEAEPDVGERRAAVQQPRGPRSQRCRGSPSREERGARREAGESGAQHLGAVYSPRSTRRRCDGLATSPRRDRLDPHAGPPAAPVPGVFRLFPVRHKSVTTPIYAAARMVAAEANLDRQRAGRRGRARSARAAHLQPHGGGLQRAGDRERHRRSGGGAEVRARRRAAGSDAARHSRHRGLPADPRRRGGRAPAGGHDADREGRGDRPRRRLRAGRRRLRRQAVQRARAGAARRRDHAHPPAAADERRRPRRSAAATRSVRWSWTSTATTCS